MNKMIKIDVVNLEYVKRNLYMNHGVSSVVVNPNAIAEIWPVETVNIAKKTNIVNDCEKIGTLDVARLYMMNSHHTLNNDATLRFITSESYEKLLSIIENA